MITLQNVTKLYGEKPAVWELSLEIEDGKTCVLLGKSGCGKSTTLRMINRLIAPTSGTICVDGKDINDILLKLCVGVLVMWYRGSAFSPI